MNSNKYLEYYLDSKVYSNEEVQNSIDKTKKEFPNKNIKVEVFLNEFGVYVITFEFENKNTYFNRIKVLLRKKHNNKLMLEGNKESKYIKELYNKDRNSIKKEKEEKRIKKYSGDNRYGKYKNTGIYHPY